MTTINDLTWIKAKHPANSRVILYSDHFTDGGVYRVRRVKDLNTQYKTSFIPNGGVEVDLGYYRTRREANARVVQHLDGS